MRHSAGRSGEFLVTGGRNQAWHFHAGAPASIRMARIEVEHHSAQPLSLALEELLWMRAHCMSERWDEVTPLAPTSLTLDEGRAIPAAEEISIPPGPHRITISWEPVLAYQACDRFALRLTFRTSSGRQVVEIPFDVVREDAPHE